MDKKDMLGLAGIGLENHHAFDNIMLFFASASENSTRKEGVHIAYRYLGLVWPLLQGLCFNLTVLNHLPGL